MRVTIEVAVSVPSVLSRTKSRYADDKAIDNFEPVARDTELFRAKSAFDAAMEDNERDRQAYLDIVESLRARSRLRFEVTARCDQSNSDG